MVKRLAELSMNWLKMKILRPEMINEKSSNRVQASRNKPEDGKAGNYPTGKWQCTVDMESMEQADQLRASWSRDSSQRKYTKIDGAVPELSLYSTPLKSKAIASGGKLKAPTSCHVDGSYLANTIPAFADERLQNIRGQILSQSIETLVLEGKAKSLNASSWVQNIMSDAQEMDKSFKVALGAYNQSSSLQNMTDIQFLSALKSGHYTGRKIYNGVNGSALLAAISTKLGAIANRSFARDVRCWSEAGAWPN